MNHIPDQSKPLISLAMNNHEEHNEQVMLMQWWALSCRQWDIPEECLFAIPNGARTNIGAAVKLKAEGVRSGVPDLFLAYPKGDKHGLFIEMKKVKGGKVSENQKKVIAMLNKNGYYAVVANGFEWARKAIVAYCTGDLRIC